MQRRAAGVVVALFGIALVLVGATSYSWWTFHEGASETVGVGLHGMKACHEGQCQAISYEQIGANEETRTFFIVGSITFYGAFVTGLATLVTAGFALLRKQAPSFVSPARIGALLCLLLIASAIAFVLLRPRGGPELSVGFSLFALILGALAAGIGNSLLMKPVAERRPHG